MFEEISETSNKEFSLRISFDLIVRFAAIGRDIKCVAKLRRHQWECGRFHVNSVLLKYMGPLRRPWLRSGALSLAKKIILPDGRFVK